MSWPPDADEVAAHDAEFFEKHGDPAKGVPPAKDCKNDPDEDDKSD